MFPLTDSLRSYRFPYFNFFIIFLTIYIFIQEIIAPDSTQFINQYALIPSKINFIDYRTLVPFVTAIFLHAGILHIISNMWFLWVFGKSVETSISPPIFLLLYITAGIVGNVAQYLIMPSSLIPMLGASGAVAGILGFYFIHFPYSKIKTFIFIFFFVTIIEIKAPLMLGYWVVLQLFSGFSTLPDSSNLGGIAFFAHIAGFLTGILFAIIFKPKPQPEYLGD